MAEAPVSEPRKLLAARLVALGAIPIAVFCAVYVLARAFLGLETVQSQVWVLSMALAASVASLFLLASLASRTVVGEVQAVREAVRHVADGGVKPELPELTPPLEDLKREVLNLAEDFQGQRGRLQERLDVARQQIFFLSNHDPLTGLPNRKALEERSYSAVMAATGLLYLAILTAFGTDLVARAVLRP